MRFELTTSTLARLRSTPELRPLICAKQAAISGSARLSLNAPGNATTLHFRHPQVMRALLPLHRL